MFFVLTFPVLVLNTDVLFLPPSELIPAMGRSRRRSRSAPVAQTPSGTKPPRVTHTDLFLAILISISAGFNMGRVLRDGYDYDDWQFSWKVQLSFCWTPYLMRRYLPLPVVGLPLEYYLSLAAIVLPLQELRWLCPDLWVALPLVCRLGLTLPHLMAARITELRAATMQTFPESWQPDQQIITRVVKI